MEEVLRGWFDWLSQAVRAVHQGAADAEALQGTAAGAEALPGGGCAPAPAPAPGYEDMALVLASARTPWQAQAGMLAAAALTVLACLWVVMQLRVDAAVARGQGRWAEQLREAEAQSSALVDGLHRQLSARLKREAELREDVVQRLAQDAAQEVAALEARLGGVEAALDGVQGRLGGAEAALGGVEAALDRLRRLGARVDGLEVKLNRLGSELEVLAAALRVSGAHAQPASAADHKLLADAALSTLQAPRPASAADAQAREEEEAPAAELRTPAKDGRWPPSAGVVVQPVHGQATSTCTRQSKHTPPRPPHFAPFAPFAPQGGAGSESA